MEQETGVAPLAARPGEQHTVLFSLRAGTRKPSRYAARGRARLALASTLASHFLSFSYKRKAPQWALFVYGAGNGSRTRRNQLGKLAPYR